MSRTLVFSNRQRVRRSDTALLRRITLHVLREQLQIADFELALHPVAAPEMARVNQAFLNHEGSTDVITFNHSEEACINLHGEIFLCLDDAVKQATQFRTTWQSEVARYVIHGLLHLCGHDDLKPVARRVMKREENRLVREISTEYSLTQLECRKPKRETNSSVAPRTRSAN